MVPNTQLHASQVALPLASSTSLQASSQNPSPQLVARHELTEQSSTAATSSSNTSSNEAINRAILIEKPTLASFAAGEQTEAVQNETNELIPPSQPTLSAPPAPGSVPRASPNAATSDSPQEAPKSRTHILRNLFFSLPSPANITESQQSTGLSSSSATVECDQAKDALLLPTTKTTALSAALSSPLSSTSSSSVQSIPGSTAPASAKGPPTASP